MARGSGSLNLRRLKKWRLAWRREDDNRVSGGPVVRGMMAISKTFAVSPPATTSLSELPRRRALGCHRNLVDQLSPDPS